MTAVRANGWRERYAYDGAGNVTTAEAPGHPDPGAREFDGTLIRRSGRTRYEHDAQGRLVRKTLALLNGQKREWTFTWNAEDRLTVATNPDGETWAYAYDPLGRRTAKWRVDETGSAVDRTAFSWDGTRLAEEVTAEGAARTWDYVPGTHRVVAQTTHHAETATLIDRLITPAGAARFHVVITDLIGTPTELVALDGAVIGIMCRTLWGTALPAAAGGVADCPLRFPGQYADAETGLYHNLRRNYDPAIAGYVSPDPLGLAPADNQHGYVLNPLSWTDPTGLTPCWSASDDDLDDIYDTYGPAVAQGVEYNISRYNMGATTHALNGIGTDAKATAQYLAQPRKFPHVDSSTGNSISYDSSNHILVIRTPQDVHAYNYTAEQWVNAVGTRYVER